MPDIGNHPSITPNRIISKRASQNVGIEKPKKTNIDDALSNNEYCFVAETTPIGIAITIIMISERAFISRVIGILSDILSITGLASCENDVPKSKIAMSLTQRKYWKAKGLSRLYNSRNFFNDSAEE
jgi:hypothetical protein